MSLPLPYLSFVQGQTEALLRLELGRARTGGSTLDLLILKPDGSVQTIAEGVVVVTVDANRGIFTYSTVAGDLAQMGLHVAYLRETLAGPTRTHFSPVPVVFVTRRPSDPA